MAIKLDNIETISPNATGPVVVTSDVNLTGTPAPVYRINGTPLAGQTPWLSNVNAAGFNLTGAGMIGATSVIAPQMWASSFVLAGTGGNEQIRISPTTLVWYGPGALARWGISRFDAETGGNTGSNLYLERYNDAGTLSGVVLTVNRATGNIGIGTQTPSHVLHVAGDVNLTAPDGIGAGTLRATGGQLNIATPTVNISANQPFGFSTLADFRFSNESIAAPDKSIVLIRTSVGGSLDSGAMSIWLTIGGVMFERLRFDQWGTNFISPTIPIYLTGPVTVNNGAVFDAAGAVHFYGRPSYHLGFDAWTGAPSLLTGAVIRKPEPPTTTPTLTLRSYDGGSGAYLHIDAPEDGGGPASITSTFGISPAPLIINLDALVINGLPTTAPPAGSHQLWADPADGYRVKWAI